MRSTIILKNQFGEQSNNLIMGGSAQLQCDFIVDPTNGNGLGNRSLKGTGNPAGVLDVKNVFMATEEPPEGGNPNPGAGIVVVQFQKPYAGYISGSAGFVSPVSGSALTTVVAGTFYVITSLGTTTLTQWVTAGLPPGTTPAVGAGFVAKVSAAIGGTGAVMVPATAGSDVDHAELLSDPNATLDVTGGGFLYVGLYKENALSAPAPGSVIGLTFDLLVVPAPLI